MIDGLRISYQKDLNVDGKSSLFRMLNKLDARRMHLTNLMHR